MSTLLHLPLRRVGSLLVAVLVIVVAAGFFAEYARYFRHGTSQLINYFSLSEEQNVPSWWSSSLLLACSVALCAVTAATPRGKGAFRAHWAALAVIFCYLSLDELVEIHERLNDLPALSTLHGVVYYGWVIPAGVVIVIFAASYLRFLVHLPRETRVKVALAGACYVGGALGVELLLGLWAERHGELNFGWAIIDLVEEALEMAGASLFLYALLEYLGRRHADLRLVIGPASGQPHR